MDTSQIPIMGICMGHQLVALAAGARTIKLKYGVSNLWFHCLAASDIATRTAHTTFQLST